MGTVAVSTDDSIGRRPSTPANRYPGDRDARRDQDCPRSLRPASRAPAPGADTVTRGAAPAIHRSPRAGVPLTTSRRPMACPRRFAIRSPAPWAGPASAGTAGGRPYRRAAAPGGRSGRTQGVGFRQALLDHHGDELLGDPAAGRAGAEDRDGVLAERAPVTPTAASARWSQRPFPGCRR